MINTPVTKFLAVCIAVSLIASQAHAASITVVGPGTTGGGKELWEFFLNTEGDTFDTFELTLTSAGLFNQAGTAGVHLDQPSEDSGFIKALINPAGFGGQDLTDFGVEAATDTASLVSGTHASIGDNSASTQGNFIIAQIVFTNPGGLGSFEANFFDDGGNPPPTPNSTDSGTFGVIPEPSTLALVGLSLIGMIATRRRLRSPWANPPI